MARLRERSFKEIREFDSVMINENHRHFDERLRELDDRRIVQLDLVEEGASDAETIANLRTTVNLLLTALNASDLTDE